MHGRRLVAVAHALQRPRLVRLRLDLDRVRSCSSAWRSGPVPTTSTVGRDVPPPPKISPNSTMNMIGNANVKKNAGRSRRNMRTLASTTAPDAADVHSRNSVPVASRKTSSSVGWRTERPRSSTPRCSASATSPSSVRCGSMRGQLVDAVGARHALHALERRERVLVEPVALEDHARAAAQAVDQRLRRVERDDAAAVHDRDAIAQRLGLVEVVRRQHDGAVLGGDRADHVPEVAARLRVEAGRGLVEEHDLGVVHEREGDREALLLAARELPRLRLGLLLEADERQQARRPAFERHAVEAREEVEQLGRREVLEQRVLLQLHADAGSARASGWARRPDRGSRSIRRRAASSPSIISSVVVLPAPFGPRMPNVSPRATANDTPCDRVHIAVTLLESVDLDRVHCARCYWTRRGGSPTRRRYQYAP